MKWSACKVGNLLQSLEVAERAQLEGHYIVDYIVANSEGLRCRLGQSEYQLATGMDPDDIVNEVQASGIYARRVPAGFADSLSVEEPASIWSAWAQLHYDLGASESQLSIYAPPLSFAKIRLLNEAAEISVTDGVSIGTEIVPLGTSVMEALPVELVINFRNRDSRMKFDIYGTDWRSADR